MHTKKDMSGQYDPLPNENIQTNAQSPVRIYLVDGIVRIDSPYPVMDITVYGTSGQTLVRQQNGGDRIDISALSAGIYFVKVRTEQGTTVQKSLLVFEITILRLIICCDVLKNVPVKF